MRDRVILIRHGEDPPDDRVHTYFLRRGFVPDVRRPYAGQRLDAPDARVAGTVIYGGPYDAFATDRHPFLRDEYRWIDACLKADIPVLGICQGAQMIALHLGAEVGPKADEVHEFGYYRVEPTEAGRRFLPEPHWFTQAHYHTFSIPAGAEHLARSDLYENQAFRYGDKVFGVQFHPEVTIEGFRRWQTSGWAAYDKPGAQTAAEQTRLMHMHDARQAAWFEAFLSDLFGTATVPQTDASPNLMPV